MGSLRRSLARAFAVDPPGPAEPTRQEQEAVDWFCRQVARRHLTTPGLIALELSRPLNSIIAQTMHFAEPGVWAVAPPKAWRGYRDLARFLERRGSIEFLARRIEEYEREYEDRRREAEAPGGPTPTKSSDHEGPRE